jgi:hypothetical protein
MTSSISSSADQSEQANSLSTKRVVEKALLAMEGKDFYRLGSLVPVLLKK